MSRSKTMICAVVALGVTAGCLSEDVCSNPGSACADSDGDGVLDTSDICEGTTTDAAVDDDGCAVDQALPFQTGTGGTGVMDLAADFSIRTMKGDWTFSEEWTGEDSYVFILNNQSSNEPTTVWESEVADIFTRSARNVHYFFGSYHSTYHDDVVAMKWRIDDALFRLEDSEREYWSARVHYIDRPVSEWAGSIDGFRGAIGGYKFAIDRLQRWREIGSLYDWIEGDYVIGFVGNESHYFNYEYEVTREMATIGATEVALWAGDTRHGGGWGEGFASTVTVELPTAEEMKSFDSMALYLYMACPDHRQGKAAGCNEWDYIANLYLCDPLAEGADESELVCTTEIGRWVSPYGREGQWLTDISPLLALITDGGERSFRFAHANGYDLQAKLLLWDADKGYRPVSAQYLWGNSSGTSFDGDYNNELHPDVSFTITEDVGRVELFSVVSGHGHSSTTENCAEFCNHEHEFSLNGSTTFTESHEVTADHYGCLSQAADGGVPNQFGTWIFGRGGWCAGMDVKPWVVDLSEGLVSGDNALQYRAYYNGADYVPSVTDADGYLPEIKMASWLIFYELR